MPNAIPNVAFVGTITNRPVLRSPTYIPAYIVPEDNHVPIFGYMGRIIIYERTYLFWYVVYSKPAYLANELSGDSPVR